MAKNPRPRGHAARGRRGLSGLRVRDDGGADPVKALGRLLEKRIYDWFFDRFSLVSAPVLVLFWIGVVRRLGDHGLTEPRLPRGVRR